MVLLSLCTSCGTVTPDPVISEEGSFDSTTPKQYDPARSGFCFFTVDSNGNTTGAVYTSAAITRYQSLLASYRLQLKEDRNKDVQPTDGIKPFVDSYGNALFWIDSEHLGYWLKLNRWKREKVPEDSLWLKMKNIVNP